MQRVQNLISLLQIEEKAALLMANSSAIDRLGLPSYQWGAECERGSVSGAAGTGFPSGIGLGSSWNRQLVGAVGLATAIEVRASYNVQNTTSAPHHGVACFAPVINSIRDGRWGRTNEMLGGECPTLLGALGSAFAVGLQSLSAPSAAPGERYTAINTIAKHLAVYSGPEGNYADSSNQYPGAAGSRFNSTSSMDERTWREYFLPSWEAVARAGGVSGYMSSYSALNLTDMTPATAARWAAMTALNANPGSSGSNNGGSNANAVPDTANSLMLTDIVRGEWGVPGYVLSDAGAVVWVSLYGGRGHQYAANYSDAAVKALSAGVDIELICCGFPTTYNTLPDSVAAGIIPEALLDQSLARTLPYRFQDATLDGPAYDPWAGLGWANISQPSALALARTAAAQGIVLLKNSPAPAPASSTAAASGSASAPFLPFTRASAAGKVIAVVGPNANDTIAQMGGYGNANPPFIITPYAGLADAVSGYGGAAAGVRLITDPVCGDSQCPGFDPATVTAAGQADVIVVVLGTTASTKQSCVRHENYNEKEGCDRYNVSLPGAQLALLQALAALNKPLVLVLVNAGMLDVDWAVATPGVTAILHAPFLGMYSGTAVAGAMTGDVNPAGRLTATWYAGGMPASLGDITDYRMRADASSGYPGRTYLYTSLPTTFPFGYGGSYAAFSYDASSITVSPPQPAPCDAVTMTITVHNTSPADGEEVVQMYASQPNASAPVPQRLLADFARVAIPAGGQATVTLTLAPFQNSLLREGDLLRVVEPGPRSLWIGGCSDPARLPGASATFTTTGITTPVAQCAAAIAPA